MTIGLLGSCQKDEAEPETEPNQVVTDEAKEGFVDLGVKNKNGETLYWAEKNLGATNPQDFGDYFAWGETEPYYTATGGWLEPPVWKSGKESAGYYWNSYCGQDNFVEWTTKPYDEATGILLPAYDAATKANASWRTPTADELQALLDSCYWEWTDQYNGTNASGFVVYKAKKEEDKGRFEQTTGYTSSDPNIFLPAAGNVVDLERDGTGNALLYWSSTVNAETPGEAKLLLFGMGATMHSLDRYRGLTIRPVSD